MDPLFFECVLIKFLFTDKNIQEKIHPFLKSDVFDQYENKKIIKEFLSFYEKYKKFSTVKEMKALLTEKEIYDRFIYCIDLDVSEYSNEFLLESIEDFFKKKLIFHNLIDGVEKLKDDKIDSISELPDKLRESIAFSFDTEVGIDYLEDQGEERLFSHLHNRDVVVPSGIKSFDQKIDGGFHEKSINLFLAQCVDKDTKVKIRIKKK